MRHDLIGSSLSCIWLSQKISRQRSALLRGNAHRAAAVARGHTCPRGGNPGHCQPTASIVCMFVSGAHNLRAWILCLAHMYPSPRVTLVLSGISLRSGSAGVPLTWCHCPPETASCSCTYNSSGVRVISACPPLRASARSRVRVSNPRCCGRRQRALTSAVLSAVVLASIRC